MSPSHDLEVSPTQRGQGDIVDLFGHPIPACSAVTLPPALLKAFTVSRIAATGVVKLP
jgi:hypothetical protein